MAGITIDDKLPYGKKIEHLMRECALDRKGALGALALLWLWVTRNCPEGDLPMLRDSEIAGIANIHGDAHRFVTALIEAGGPGNPGFIDRTPDGLKVHDWTEWAPEYVQRKFVRKMSDKKSDKRLRKVEPVSSSRHSSSLIDVVLLFPVVGGRDLKSWELDTKYLGKLSEMFPGVNVLIEAKKALGWVEGSPRRRKTAGGMQKFLMGWMERSQNRGGSYGRGESNGTSRPGFAPAVPGKYKD